MLPGSAVAPALGATGPPPEFSTGPPPPPAGHGPVPRPGPPASGLIIGTGANDGIPVPDSPIDWANVVITSAARSCCCFFSSNFWLIWLIVFGRLKTLVSLSNMAMASDMLKLTGSGIPDFALAAASDCAFNRFPVS